MMLFIAQRYEFGALLSWLLKDDPQALVLGAFMILMISVSVVSLFLSSLPENWLQQPLYMYV